MSETTVEQYIGKLQSNREKLSSLLESVAGDQDWQPSPDEWSFRFIAAHLATVDKECYLDRVVRIASGENPNFVYYLNTGRDFSPIDLKDALREWSAARQEIVDFVKDLPEEKLMHTGIHPILGQINVLDVLKSMDKHDREHLRDLERDLENYRAKTHTG
jgi:hypothetical protein